MEFSDRDRKAFQKLAELSKESGLSTQGGRVRRTSSRFCLGVEHGDYNGTELFGVGTDRFIWLAYKGNGTDRMRLFSGNFPGDGVIGFRSGEIPEPRSPSVADTWGRFAYGVDFILRREGFVLDKGADIVLFGDIPGGGLSRSASLTLNLLQSLLNVQDLAVEDPFRLVDMAQAVENDYIGSPCGQLDQIMILFAEAGQGTHHDPKARAIHYIPLGAHAPDFRIVGLDTGTDRPGLEKSTYRIRRAECETLVGILQESGYRINTLADVRDKEMYRKIQKRFGAQHPDLLSRLKYIYEAQKRFCRMLEAWKSGDIPTVGRIFREDGFGLRDDYQISGPELETMCDIARTVDGVYGERMLGGGDKGASGALVRADSVEKLKRAVDAAYPQRFPDYADKYAVHVFKTVDGVRVFDGVL